MVAHQVKEIYRFCIWKKLTNLLKLTKSLLKVLMQLNSVSCFISHISYEISILDPGACLDLLPLVAASSIQKIKC